LVLIVIVLMPCRWLSIPRLASCALLVIETPTMSCMLDVNIASELSAALSAT
jgi:hypothetical protein